ncbi:hypothetical protein IQ272_29365 [Chroococcidiopsidales cyanobacterium LEGE 13417]|nr:hypothetical protein [Chroococcidiopsidales cyanobacterium LEGE 13417]
MTQESLSEEQLAELAEIAELAKIAEQKAREMSEFATAIAQKYQQRLSQMQQTAVDRRD